MWQTYPVMRNNSQMGSENGFLILFMGKKHTSESSNNLIMMRHTHNVSCVSLLFSYLHHKQGQSAHCSIFLFSFFFILSGRNRFCNSQAVGTKLLTFIVSISALVTSHGSFPGPENDTLYIRIFIPITCLVGNFYFQHDLISNSQLIKMIQLMSEFLFL